ncbi:MAG: MBL fold metallo-hydrolase [Pseudomonadota bacterium]
MMDVQDFDPPLGIAQTLEPRVRRIVAPNPSPMTFRGTNSYLVGATDVAIIDPGPDKDSHLQAILRALTPAQRITHIFVSHAHLDHSPLATPLHAATGAPVLAFGPAEAGRSSIMQHLAATGLMGGGEGIDQKFKPDITLRNGDCVAGPDWQLSALHTPGHMGNHLCFAMEDICFTADHVMGWASSLVSPPDGDLTDFMTSCANLCARQWRVFYPGHGPAIDAPLRRLDELIAHREGRQAAILSALAREPLNAKALAAQIYVETPAAMMPAAERNVLAHLVDLTQKSLVEPLGPLNAGAMFREASR